MSEDIETLLAMANAEASGARVDWEPTPQAAPPTRTGQPAQAAASSEIQISASVQSKDGNRSSVQVTGKVQGPDGELFHLEDVGDQMKFPLTDAGAGERIEAAARGRIAYIPEKDSWMVWNGCRWLRDWNHTAERIALAVIRAARFASSGYDAEFAEALRKHAHKYEAIDKIRAALSALKIRPGVVIPADQWDSDKLIVGTAEGDIDLRTGLLLPPDPSRRTTKHIGTTLQPGASCPRWLKFLERIMTDPSLVEYLQTVAGYCLTGDVTEEALFFAFGSGRNGKSVFVETIAKLLGDYGRAGAESLLLADPGKPQQKSGASPEIAELAGLRLVHLTETPEAGHMAESRVKQLTSREPIRARHLYQSGFDFTPTHKLIVSGNHKPRITGTDNGIWRRLQLIPFTVTIPQNEVDKRLSAKLAEELPGILNWALDGCLRWQREGLRIPKVVADAVAEYRRNEDILGSFLEDCVIMDSFGEVLCSSMFEAYCRWSESEGINPRFRWTHKALNKRLEERGFFKTRKAEGVAWQSLALK